MNTLFKANILKIFENLGGHILKIERAMAMAISISYLMRDQLFIQLDPSLFASR